MRDTSVRGAPSPDDGGASITEDPDHDTTEDVSLLEYARFYGLCHDYTTTDPLDPSYLPDLCPEPDLDSDYASLTELLPSLSHQEKWTLDWESAKFLKSVTLTEEIPDEESRNLQRFLDLKVEEPLLRTDPQLDANMFRYRRQAGDPFTMSDCNYFATEESIERTLEWPDPELPAKKGKEAHAERLHLDTATVSLLKQVSKGAEMNLEDELLFAGDLANRRPRLGCVTPPLLPLSPPFTPANPPSPVGRLELATSPMDPTADELDALEERMVEEDAVLRPFDSAIGSGAYSVVHSSDICCIYPPLRSLVNSDSSSPLQRAKRERSEDLKVEVPLTPPIPQLSLMKKPKLASFDDDVNVLGDACLFSPIELRPVEEDYVEFFDKVIQVVAEPAIHVSNHEQLSEADSVNRVEVPTIDHPTPPLPWKMFSRKSVGHMAGLPEIEAQRRMLSALKRSVLKDEREWPGLSMINKILDRWEPFPDRLRRVDLEERFGDGSEGRYLSLLKYEEPDVSTLLWKLEGLKVLEESDDDEYGIDEADLTTMVPGVDSIDSSSTNAVVDLSNSRLSNNSSLVPEIPVFDPDQEIASVARKKTDIIHNSTTGANAFSAESALSRFIQTTMGLSGKAEPFVNKTRPHSPTEKIVETSSFATERQDLQDRSVQRSWPTPEVPLSMPPRPFIIPTSILAQRRGLVQEIERLYPEVIFVERDLAARAAPQSSVQAPSLHEADLLVSAGTGIIFTTLQKIKQKPLPGQKNHAGIHERIASLSLRYEVVIVLVSEGEVASSSAGHTTIRTLDERDCDALSLLIGYTATLDTDVQVLYIPGGDTALARWTVSCAARYVFSCPHVTLLPDETIWELFLRRAGMNAFAAQAVLSILKAPAPELDNTPNTTANGVYGLAGFLGLNVEERIAKFECFMGGHKMLRRVSSAVSGAWNSAARTEGRTNITR